MMTEVELAEVLSWAFNARRAAEQHDHMVLRNDQGKPRKIGDRLATLYDEPGISVFREADSASFTVVVALDSEEEPARSNTAAPRFTVTVSEG